MYDHGIDLDTLGGRLARVRETYGKSIDVPHLGSDAFAAFLGVPPAAYASIERGEREPTVDLLVALRSRIHISLDWFLDPDDAVADRPPE